MPRYVFPPSCWLLIKKKKKTDNRLALSQACKCCRCKVTAPPPTPPPPPSALPHLPQLLQGKQQRAAGAPCQMCQVMTANGPWIKELRGGRYESGLEKKNHPWLLSSDVLIFCFSKFPCLIGNLLIFPSCNLIIALPFHKHPLAHLYFSIHL